METNSPKSPPICSKLPSSMDWKGNPNQIPPRSLYIPSNPLTSLLKSTATMANPIIVALLISMIVGTSFSHSSPTGSPMIPSPSPAPAPMISSPAPAPTITPSIAPVIPPPSTGMPAPAPSPMSPGSSLENSAEALASRPVIAAVVALASLFLF
ncbi:Cellulase protein [Dioscorea alata]|uniref:Cellulase protein n=1 Tax=Dioscorea alata TaxID=55571 RepID=A0ACB7U9I0_DIOAL|nr:Cellulase protein [Dioscorea alata]